MRRPPCLLVLVGVLAACSVTSPGPAPSGPSPATTAETSDAAEVVPTGTVTVEISDVRGASGSHLAVVIFDRGGAVVRPGAEPVEEFTGHGGFVVAVDADPFSVTRTLQEGPPLLEDYPSTGPDAAVPVGEHTLLVAVSSDLGPYSAWMPADPVEQGCELQVTVTAGRTTTVRLTELPAWDISAEPTCTAGTEEQPT